VDNEKEVVDKLNAFEMWVWRRMEKVSWQDKKTNEEVLATVGGEVLCTCNSEAEKELDRCCAREQFVRAYVREKNSGEETKREAKDGHD
jgi:hypothetical protein